MRQAIVGYTRHRVCVGGVALALMAVGSAALAAPQRNDSILSRKHNGAVRGAIPAGDRSKQLIQLDDAAKARVRAATGGALEAAVFDQPNDSGFGWFLKSDDVFGYGTWATQQIFGNGFVPGDAISSYETLFFNSPMEDPAIGDASVMTELWDGDPFSVMDTVCAVGGVSSPIPGTQAIFSDISYNSVTRLRAELPAKVTIGCDRVWTVMTMLEGCRGTWRIAGTPGNVFDAPPTTGSGSGVWVLWACEQFTACETLNGYNSGTCCNSPSTPCDHTDDVFECPTGHPTFCGDGAADFFFANINEPDLFHSLVSSVFAATGTTMSVVVASVDSPPGGGGPPPGVISLSPEEVVLEKGSHNVWLEIMIGDWDPDDTGVTLAAYNAALDATSGFSSGIQGTLTPYVGPFACGACTDNGATCSSHSDCNAGACSGSGTACHEPIDCPSGQSCDGGAVCTPTVTGDADCAAALGVGAVCGPSGYYLGSGTCGWLYTYVDDPRWALQDAGATLGAVDLSSIDARVGHTIFFGPANDPEPFPDGGMYGATLAVHVPADAKGTFTIGLKPFPASNLVSGDRLPIPLVGLVSAAITIQTGRCCFIPDGADLGGGVCLDQLMTANSCAQGADASLFTTNEICPENGGPPCGGCDPNVPPSFDDGDACTDDECIDGNPVHTPTICDDGVICTEDFCDSAIGCFSQPLICDDGLGCTVDFCKEPIGCVSVPVDVDDLDDCTIDTCNEPDGIVKHTNNPICIPVSDDCWTTNEFGTQISLCNCPIPAGFFCLGSQPFAGTIDLVSATGAQDTIIQRLESMQLPAIGSVASTPLQVAELQLTSVEPLVVICDGLRAFDVAVTLSDFVPSTGEMTVTKTQEGGGTFTSVLHIVPKLTFTRVDDPSDVRVLDAGLAGCPPDEIVTTDAPWVHELSFDPGPGEICGENFVPGSQADPDTGSSCCVPVCHAAATATHCNVVGTICPCCPGGGACCDPADPKGCIELTATGRCSNDPTKPCTIPEECSKGGFNVTCLEPGGGLPKCAEQVCTEMGRVYQGDNTDCTDSDGDGLPNVVETGGSGGCCAFAGVVCSTGTDPNNPDSDGDGISDGDEINGGTDPCKADKIVKGPNCFRTPCEATKLNFSFMMIPADFFGPGSDPFTDVVPLGGADESHCTHSGLPCVTDSDCPLVPEDVCVQADTILSREEDAVLSGPGSSVTIPIELVALSLANCEPIIVEYDGGASSQQWDVAVTLSGTGRCSISQTSCEVDSDCPPTEACETVPSGAMSITRTHENGGYFTSSFFVQPILTFTRVGNTGDVRVFDTGAEGIAPMMLESDAATPWAGNLQVPVSLSCSPGFVPGVVQNPEDPLDICCEPVGHSSGVDGHLHKTGEVCGPCPRGACSLPGGKCKLAEGDENAGIAAEEVCMTVLEGMAYAGDGTNCDDSDSDGIANVFETADCKGLPGDRVPWDTGTDPNNPDTDGDGILDGEEIARGTDPCVACLVAAPAVPNPATPDIGFGAMNRHLSFLSGQPGRQQAISVVFKDLPGDHARFNGLRMWVAEPEEISEAGGVREPIPDFPTFQLSGLGCEPVYRDWHGVCDGVCDGGVNAGVRCVSDSGCPGGVCIVGCVGGLREGEACSGDSDCLGALFVADEEIVPGASYEVQIVDSSCPPDRDDSFSAPLTLNTSEYGDILGNCATFPCSPPNGAFDIDDCLGILGRFASSPISPIKARTDLEPSVLDQTINVTDVLECIRSFVGLDYRFSPGISKCPADLWTTWSDGTPDQSYMDVTLPADFLGPGCDAFADRVEFRGRPIDPSQFGDADTLIKRPFDPVSPDDPPGTQGTVPIELVELSLESIVPITVTCFGEPTEWVVEAELSSVVDAPTGSLTALKTHDNGGVFSSVLFVEPSLTFTNVADPTRVVRMHKPHGSTKRFLSVDVPFVHHIYSALDVTRSPGALFIPGVHETIAGDRTSQVPTVVQERQETTPGDEPEYIHTICPPRKQKKCIMRVTCVDGTCDNCPITKDDLCYDEECVEIDTCESFSRTCGEETCCLQYTTEDCRIPEIGMPPCPTGDSCTCNEACTIGITDTPAAWLPEGRKYGTAVGDPGNSVDYTATITAGGPRKIRFFLEGVSSEPGVCINYGGESGATPDLKFRQTATVNPATIFEAPSPDGQTITTKRKVNSVTVTVTSYDWGAWGNIKACALKNDGSGCLCTTLVKKIPVDELPAGGNHIADAWQSANSGKAATWDDDAAPANMKRNGDGYSFYEEYRGAMKGFIVSHARLDPAEKDLFIYDEDLLHLRGHSGHKFIFLTLMNIHYVNGDPAKLMNGAGTAAGGHRWINRKSEFGKIANQYALHIKKFDLVGAGNWGLVDGPSLGPPKTADPLVKVDDAQVATDLSGAVTGQGGNPATTEKAAFENVRDREITTTTTHEMGHGCALPHHSCANGGRNGGYGDEHCGDITCVMRYDFDLVEKADAAVPEHAAMYGARTLALSPPATSPVRFRFSNYTDKDLSDLTPVLNTFCTVHDKSRQKMDVKDNP